MKISRSELRRMIFESILQEKKGGFNFKNAIKKIKQSFNPNLLGIPDSSGPQESSPNGNSDGSKSPTSAPAPSPAAAGTATAITTTKKQPNRKVKQIQELINVYYDAGGIQPNKKIREDGYWGGETDRGLKDIFTFLNLPNPGEKWGKISQYLREKSMGDFPATLSGLINYLTSDAVVEAVSKEEAPASTPINTPPSVERVLTAAEQASRKEQEELAAALGWNSDGSPDNPLAFLDKLSQTLTGSEEIQKFSKTPEFLKLFQSTKKESFGKSHATLIRERYWGRY